MWMLAPGLLAGVAVGLYAWSSSLSRRFDQRRSAAAAVPLSEPFVLTEDDLEHLPDPVRRYIVLTGSIGRPVVTEIVMHFDATMYDAPGASGMAGPVVQFERFDTPDRLFFMKRQ